MPSFTSPNPHPDRAVQAIDELFKATGLVRNLRGKAAPTTRRMRFDRAATEELRRQAPPPRVASNGVEWLPVPEWEKLRWLWHGFSTRRGGLSHPYCAEDAPGELNLGFTEADNRQTVIRNRRLLAEAITADPSTPIVTLRQIHSNVLHLAAGDPALGRSWKAGVPSDGSMSLGGKATA